FDLHLRRWGRDGRPERSSTLEKLGVAGKETPARFTRGDVNVDRGDRRGRCTSLEERRNPVLVEVIHRNAAIAWDQRDGGSVGALGTSLQSEPSNVQVSFNETPLSPCEPPKTTTLPPNVVAACAHRSGGFVPDVCFVHFACSKIHVSASGLSPFMPP